VQPSRPWRIALALGVGLAVTGAAVAIGFRDTNSSPIADVCKTLSDAGQHATVPSDVVARSAETLDAELSDVTATSHEDVGVARRAITRAMRGHEVARTRGWAVCRVDYSRPWRAGDPEPVVPPGPRVVTSHFTALLIYHDAQTPVEPCFGTVCPSRPPTYTIHCATLLRAETGDVLRPGGCWGFRPIG
jgi:hypothetical protein